MSVVCQSENIFVTLWLADLFSFSKPGVPNKKMPPRTGMEESEEAN